MMFEKTKTLLFYLNRISSPWNYVSREDRLETRQRGDNVNIRFKEELTNNTFEAMIYLLLYKALF